MRGEREGRGRERAEGERGEGGHTEKGRESGRTNIPKPPNSRTRALASARESKSPSNRTRASGG